MISCGKDPKYELPGNAYFLSTSHRIHLYQQWNQWHLVKGKLCLRRPQCRHTGVQNYNMSPVKNSGSSRDQLSNQVAQTICNGCIMESSSRTASSRNLVAVVVRDIFRSLIFPSRGIGIYNNNNNNKKWKGFGHLAQLKAVNHWGLPRGNKVNAGDLPRQVLASYTFGTKNKGLK